MKIHFRRVDGERTMYLEISDNAFCGFGTRDHVADLPGEPLKYSDMNATLLKRLRDEHFLDVEADMAATCGTVTLQLPNPVALLKTTRLGDWKQARDQVKHKVADLPEYQVLAQWWETLRRSDAYRRDCEARREELARGERLLSLAFAGKLDIISCLREFEYFCSTSFVFKNVWCLPLAGGFFFLWPKLLSEEIVSILLCTYPHNNLSNIFHMLNVPPKSEQGFSFCRGFSHTPDLSNLYFFYPCDKEMSVVILNTLFRSGLDIVKFDYYSTFGPFTEDGIFFVVKMKDSDKPFSQKEKAVHRTRDRIMKLIADAIRADLPTVQPWDQRRRLDPLKLRRELAAFDGRTDLDAELWPGLSGKSLVNSKSKARTVARKRISALEKAAEERRRTLSPQGKKNAFQGPFFDLLTPRLGLRCMGGFIHSDLQDPDRRHNFTRTLTRQTPSYFLCQAISC